MRTEEQRVIDDLVAAKVRLDGPEADGWREILAAKKQELDGFIEASKNREEELLAKQASERDDFARGELSDHVGIQSVVNAYTHKLERLGAIYAEAFDAVRQHYASTYAEDDRSASIRSALIGDVDNVETVLHEESGDIVTRIRRGLQSMTEAEECFWGGAKNDLEGSPEAFEPAPGGLGADNIAEALERAAATIGEDVKSLGLDFSLDGEHKN